MISKETKEYLKEIGKDLWYYSSLSFSMAIAIVIGVAAGHFVDCHYHTTPMWTLIGMGAGVVAGFKNIYLAMKRAGRMK